MLLIMYFYLQSPGTSSLINSQYPTQHTKSTVKRIVDLLRENTFKIRYGKRENKRELVWVNPYCIVLREIQPQNLLSKTANNHVHLKTIYA
jgi:hypothetical protein